MKRVSGRSGVVVGRLPKGWFTRQLPGGGGKDSAEMGVFVDDTTFTAACQPASWMWGMIENAAEATCSQTRNDKLGNRNASRW